MCKIIIWRVDGEVTTIYTTEDLAEYEMQVLNTDPMVKEYSVESL